MSNIIDTGKWNTVLLILGDCVKPNSISVSEKKNWHFLKKGELIVPTVDKGSTRHYDLRYGENCLKSHLTGKQYSLPLIEQLNIWCQELEQYSKEITLLNQNGSWVVIDCNGGFIPSKEKPCLQFRLTTDVLSKLSELRVELEFSS